jgi:hypothetical protein
MAAGSRRDLEDLWRNRLTVSMERYRIARVECKEAALAQSDIPSPDGSFAYGRALRAESAAVKEYMRVLRIFTDLTIHRIVPPEE